jgi:hypothetical protein
VDRRSATLPSIETASIAVTRHRPASSNDRKRIHKSNVDLARKNLRASRTISDSEDERLEIILRPRGATTGCSDTIDDDDETPHEDLTVSWDEIHKFSVMVDLNIVPSDDEDDEDYTESTGDTKVTEPKYGHFIDVPNIDIHLGLPTGARTATLIFPTSPSPLSKQWCKSSTGII